MNLHSLHQQLVQLLPRTSDRVLHHYFEQTTASVKSDGSIVTEADLAMDTAYGGNDILVAGWRNYKGTWEECQASCQVLLTLILYVNLQNLFYVIV